jgi:hypothetical protein
MAAANAASSLAVPVVAGAVVVVGAVSAAVAGVAAAAVAVVAGAGSAAVFAAGGAVTAVFEGTAAPCAGCGVAAAGCCAHAAVGVLVAQSTAIQGTKLGRCLALEISILMLSTLSKVSLVLDAHSRASNRRRHKAMLCRAQDRRIVRIDDDDVLRSRERRGVLRGDQIKPERRQRRLG